MAKIRKLDALRGEGRSTLLSTAALYGQLDVARYLIEKGANVNAANRDGNAPLHTAAFLCRKEFVKLLLKNGASVSQKNGRGETPINVVSGRWDDGLANFYRRLASGIGIDVDLGKVKQQRPQIAKLLREHTVKANK